MPEISKIIVDTSRKRVNKYSNLSALDPAWQLCFLPDPLQADDDDILAFCPDAEAIFVDAIGRISARVIQNMPSLKIIQSEGAGYNMIDVDAAQKAGVYVCNAAGFNGPAVAEHAVMLMLALLRRLLEGDAEVRVGRQAAAKAAYILDGVRELSSCHVGLIGLGDCGLATARLLKAFGARVSYYSKTRKAEAEKTLDISYLPLSGLQDSCDIISLHITSTPQTFAMLDADFFAACRQKPLIINTSRGELIEQKALAAAISSGQIGGAALDTLYPEPVTADNPLLNLAPLAASKIVFSPHVAGTTDAAFYKMHALAWDNIKLALSGKRPGNIVNGL